MKFEIIRKKPNPRRIGIEEANETQGQRHRKHFQQDHRKIFPSLKKELPIQLYELHRTPKRMGRKKILYGI